MTSRNDRSCTHKGCKKAEAAVDFIDAYLEQRLAA
jgi:hypothetical protein